MKVKISDNAELLEFLIEENARLNKRLSFVSKANAKRRRQLRKDHRGHVRKKEELLQVYAKNSELNDIVKITQTDLNRVTETNLKLQEEIQQLKLSNVELKHLLNVIENKTDVHIVVHKEMVDKITKEKALSKSNYKQKLSENFLNIFIIAIVLIIIVLVWVLL